MLWAHALSAHAASLYTTINSNATVQQFDIGTGGLLASKSPPTVSTGAAPDGITINQTGTSLYNPGGGSVSQFDVGAGGLLAAKSPPSVVSGGGARIGISPDGGSLYVPNGTTVGQFDVGAGGLLTPKAPATVAAGSTPLAVAVSPDGKSAYVANTGSNSISQYDIGASGALTPKSTPTVATGATPVWISISPDGKSVYTPSYGVGNTTVSQFDVGAGGLLTPKSTPTVTVGASPAGIAFSPDGKSAYVGLNGAAAVAQLDVAANGALSLKSPATVAAGAGPTGVIVTPDGKNVYVDNFGGGSPTNNTISQFTVGTGGALSPKSPATVTTAANGPFWLAVTPDQGPKASFTAATSTVKSATIFDASASSDADGSIVQFDWDFGDGTSRANGGAKPAHAYTKTGTFTVRLTVTDDAGCSTQFVFTGQQALCNGGAAATTTRTVVIGSFGGVSIRSRSVTVRRGIAHVMLGCASNTFGSCKGRLSMRTLGKVAVPSRKKRLALGSKSFTIAPGKSKRVALKVSKAGRKVLAQTKRLRTRASVNAHDAAKVRKKTSAKVTLKLAKQRKRR
jgi:DNA-binding beta-propeller fold protein YncE